MCTSIPRAHGQIVRLKWHSLRRHAGDAPVSAANLEAGFDAGATMEADLRLTADRRWVCLHNDTLDEETTGSGPLAQHTSEDLRDLRMRTRTGAVTEAPVSFLEDLADAARRWSLSSAELQLDVKAPAEELGDDVLDRFARVVGPVSHSFSLSGTDPTALDRLRSAVPGLPVTLSCSAQLGGARDGRQFESRLESAIAQLDHPELIWVNHRVLQAAYRTGFDLVGFAHLHGVAVDTGTIDIGATGWRAALVLALQANVDRITTNTPCEVADQLTEWLKTSGPRPSAVAGKVSTRA
jgi:glycerophosphoryl diester phosphodiesterase